MPAPENSTERSRSDSIETIRDDSVDHDGDSTASIRTGQPPSSTLSKKGPPSTKISYRVTKQVAREKRAELEKLLAKLKQAKADGSIEFASFTFESGADDDHTCGSSVVTEREGKPSGPGVGKETGYARTYLTFDAHKQRLEDAARKREFEDGELYFSDHGIELFYPSEGKLAWLLTLSQADQNKDWASRFAFAKEAMRKNLPKVLASDRVMHGCDNVYYSTDGIREMIGEKYTKICDIHIDFLIINLLKEVYKGFGMRTLPIFTDPNGQLRCSNDRETQYRDW
ncbi:hypothetical protein HD553DRAFT_351517 [Filobasidium floriforme]|uniref:uncharacterized protein n=1 Tax=Filobasidium floriforme TaxID=5210 RepID=UPI001E8E2F7A|nr:uncharacterized protein HD553DRAFT_351517 [Filobasidium floriforme]KAH8081395.1 hypothetical protein HD553DRAFT_351517 [Filobasidium floriforme]